MVLWNTLNRFQSNDGSAMAGYIAFSGLLSIFPFMIFAATLTGILVGESRSEKVIDALFQIAPQHVALTLEPVVEEVLGKQSSEVLTLSALFAVWVASNAVEAFRIAFDRAYGIIDPRHFIVNRAMALGIVLLGAVVAALLGISILLSPLILRLLSEYAHVRVPSFAGYVTYGFGIGVFVGFLTLMHRWLPGRHLPGTVVWPGVIVSTLIWLAAAGGFTLYLSFTPTYTVTYGTLAGVIITLMFFYLTGATIIFGAELNAELNKLAPIQRQLMT
ncbi:YihY/virulence factor BrkB family protein [Amaricoccus solimangrovi]|uniref:YihY/virulence factor BrkB family protein n=1 Tax=Amaricoccus solimangrovi TaxID=2589815 RepID=A0A501WM70_9RHOB|nr:YihY/virulence factor BrkB family protein [Amaricoccus solimangrovi]TPE49435.1 YihY/virulence factor BrkB family protein [Amaricoccus solimangrovi]